MSPVVISGIGVVCRAAVGREELERCLSGSGGGERQRNLNDLDLSNYLQNSRMFRRGAPATRSALAAASLALRDAGIDARESGCEGTAMVVGVTHGAINYSTQFHKELVECGPLGASPLNFSESVLNAPAGNGAIAFEIRGPVHTLIGDETVGTQAVDLAASLLGSGTVERCLVIGTEELSEVVTAAYRTAGRANRACAECAGSRPAEGAAALVLEREETATGRGIVPRARIAGWELCRISGFGGKCGPAGARATETGIADAVREAFRRSGQSCAGADHVVLPTGPYRQAARQGILRARGAGSDRLREVDLRPLAGHPDGAANLLQVAASATLLSAGLVRGPGIVVSAGLERTIAAAILTGPAQGGR